jgi:hypothetical protein
VKAKLVVPLALVFVLLAAVPVYAGAPVIVTGEIDEDYVAFDPSPCPGIEIRDHELTNYRLTFFSDNQGNPVRFQVHAEGTDNFYNPANPDVVLSGHYIHNALSDQLTGDWYDFGVPYHITVSGYGTVLQISGRWFPDGRMVGKNSLDDPKDVAQFCALLAGD